MLQNGDREVRARMLVGACEVGIRIDLAHKCAIFAEKKVNARKISADGTRGGNGDLLLFP